MELLGQLLSDDVGVLGLATIVFATVVVCGVIFVISRKVKNAGPTGLAPVGVCPDFLLMCVLVDTVVGRIHFFCLPFVYQSLLKNNLLKITNKEQMHIDKSNLDRQAALPITQPSFCCRPFLFLFFI